MNYITKEVYTVFWIHLSFRPDNYTSKTGSISGGQVSGVQNEGLPAQGSRDPDQGAGRADQGVGAGKDKGLKPFEDYSGVHPVDVAASGPSAGEKEIFPVGGKHGAVIGLR